LVVEIKGERFTPPVSSGLLAGTFRAALLREGKIRERIIRPDELRATTRLFLINSVRRWREARLLEPAAPTASLHPPCGGRSQRLAPKPPSPTPPDGR
jgi:branched-subunit amino acid aminotransferase/4-amino-4-deoxychorismate lyase